MQQTPIKYWYCPQCECEVDSRNVTNDEKHDNCGTEVESRQHVQTPIEKAIAILRWNKLNLALEDSAINDIDKNISILESLLPYERKDRHDVAEKAYIAATTQSNMNTTKTNLENYLNQNHPL